MEHALKKNLKVVILSAMIFTTGCMKAKSAITDSSQKAAEAIGCTNFQSKVYDSMYEYLDNEKSAPDLNEFTDSLNEKIDTLALAQKIDNPEMVTQLKTDFRDLYKTLIEKSAELKETKTAREHLETIIELEMQDQSTDANIKLNSVVAKQFAKVDATAKALDVQCTENPDDTNSAESEPSNPSLPADNSVTTAALKGVYAGSNNVLATAYQSCQALEIPDISAATPSVVGIERYGTHPDGVGGKRRIASLSSVQSTHPYIKVAAGAQNGCFNVRTHPLIYDYGGEPKVSNNTIDLSKDSGTGTTALGVDCSAYVSSAIAAGGLRYKPGVDNKAIFIRQTSTKFINAKSSGFTCFNNVVVTPSVSMRKGDIVGVRGHVVIVDRVGSDPFGLKRLTSSSQCSSLNINYFDFSVSQSSPSKGGIGLNKYIAKDYLKESPKMAAAFQGIGKAACQAYFTSKNVATPSTDYGILRHNGTASCVSPKIKMANQSCVSQCLQ